MSDLALQFHEVWKKFRKGERFDSLRDLIPAMVKRLFGRRRSDELTDREFWAVRDVSFEVARGEALGIIGPNGAGKSTALKLLSGILRPNRGTLQVRGRLSALIEVSAGFHPDLTGRENIYLNGTILGMTRKEIDAKMDEIIAFSGLEDFIATPVKRYSSGMFARLGFSVAAHVDPEVLLVDEVLSVGDMAFQRKCVEKMQERLRSGVTVVFVSHNIHAVSTLCDRTIVLDHGQKIFEGKSDEAVAYYMAASEGPVSEEEPVVDLLEAHLRRSDGSEIDECAPGDAAEMDVVFRFREPAEAPTISLVIDRVSDGLHVYDVAADECGLERRDYAAGETLRLKFQFRANFLRGLYSVGLNVFEPKTHKFLFRKNTLFQLPVVEFRSYTGVADIGLLVRQASAAEAEC